MSSKPKGEWYKDKIPCTECDKSISPCGNYKEICWVCNDSEWMKDPDVLKEKSD